MPGPLARAWEGFCASYDPEVFRRELSPLTLFAFGALVLGVLLAMALIPSVQRYTGFDHAGGLVALFLAGLSADLLGGWFFDRPRARNGLAYFAYACNCALVPLVMVCTVSPTRYAFGLLFGQMADSYGRRFAFNWPMLVVIAVLPVSIAVVAWQDFALVVMVVFGVLMFVFNGLTTARHRQMLRQQKSLQSALSITDEVASSSLDIAFAAAQTEVGGFVHHLSNAMTPVVANLSALNAEPVADPEMRRAIELAHRGSQRACDLIDRLLETMKRRAAPAAARFHLGPLLEAVVAEHSSPRRRLRLEAAAPEVELSGNPEHLRLVLDNLLRNAFEAGASEVALSAELCDGGHELRLRVADDARGLPPNVRERLFQAPVSGGNATGHGFGLYVSRRLLELLRGRLSLARSDATGSVFELAIPVKPADEPSLERTG